MGAILRVLISTVTAIPGASAHVWSPRRRKTSPPLLAFALRAHHDEVADISKDHRAGADDGTTADPDALDDHGTGADMRVLTDADTTAQHRARCHMAVVADEAIMVDRGAAVDDGVGTEADAGLQHRAGHDLRALAQRDIMRNDRARMADGHEGIALLAQSCENFATLAVADAADPVYQ